MGKHNIIGNTYGELTVIEVHSTTRNGHKRFSCKCSCGNIKNVLGTHLKRLNTTSCGCTTKRQGKDSSLWKGCGDISGNIWYNLVVRSANGSKGRRKAVDININVQYGWNLFLKQDRKCALSGVDLIFSSMTNSFTTASLDRIDSSFGYIKGNVQWVHKDVNMMKRIYNQDYFIKWCKLIAENNS